MASVPPKEGGGHGLFAQILKWLELWRKEDISYSQIKLISVVSVLILNLSRMLNSSSLLIHLFFKYFCIF